MAKAAPKQTPGNAAAQNLINIVAQQARNKNRAKPTAAQRNARTRANQAIKVDKARAASRAAAQQQRARDRAADLAARAQQKAADRAASQANKAASLAASQQAKAANRAASQAMYDQRKQVRAQEKAAASRAKQSAARRSMALGYARKGTEAVLSPAKPAINPILLIIFTMAGLIVFYQIVTAADNFSGFLGSLQNGLRKLSTTSPLFETVPK